VALNDLFYANVMLRNYSLMHSLMLFVEERWSEAESLGDGR